MDYRKINRELWNAKTEVHFESEFYDVKSFLAGKNSLNAPELQLLGDVAGKSLLHLQCHFGMDTLSLWRMGARVAGVDISDRAIERANELTEKLGAEARFLRSDIYDLPGVLNEAFDLVFTSYGTIGWLPDMDGWAEVIAHFLKPGGTFVIVDFHPVLWMFSEDFRSIKYDYFNTAPLVEEIEGTYADRSAPIKNQAVSWNHSLSEVLGALLKHGLVLELFREYDYSPYNCFENTVEIEPGKYQIRGLEGKIPMMFALRARKK